MASTMDNLAGAFAGESQANRKYLAFAKKADEEGKPQIARLFRSAAEAETVHAHAHLRVMGGVKGTADNIKAAVEGEGFEFQQMYPGFLKQAEADKNDAAVSSFKFALAVEKIHYGLYQDALKSLQGGKDLPASAIFVCGVCGNTVLGSAPDKCTVCNAPKARFTEVK